VGSVEATRSVQRLLEASDAVDFQAINEVLSEDFVAHGSSPRFSEHMAGGKDRVTQWSAGFFDGVLTFDDFFVEDGRVAVRRSRTDHRLSTLSAADAG